jgi:hypothetical protein
MRCAWRSTSGLRISQAFKNPAPDRPAEEFIRGAWDFAWGQVAARRQVPASDALLEKVAPRTVARVIKTLLPVQHLAFGVVRGSQKAGIGQPLTNPVVGHLLFFAGKRTSILDCVMLVLRQVILHDTGR